MADKKIPVAVYLKIDKKVTGLPKEIMGRSHRLARDHGGKRKWTFGFDNRIFVTDLESEAIEKLRESPLVEKVEVQEKSDKVLTGPFPDYNPAGVNTDWGVDRVKASIAWNQGIWGQGVKLAIVDTGLWLEHEAFWKDGVSIYKGGYDFVNGDNNPHDDHGHGTWCAGIAAMQHNIIAGSYRGVAPGVELYVLKTQDSDGSGWPIDVAAGIDWCRTHGIHIISMSIGGTTVSEIRELACNNAYAAGCLLVAAAGNDGPTPDSVKYPAKYNSVIAVSAVDYYEQVATYSSRGPEVELSAPGSFIVGPNLIGFNNFNQGPIAGSNERYVCDSGTSAACPNVAAAAALIKSKYPGITNVNLRELLKNYGVRDL